MARVDVPPQVEGSEVVADPADPPDADGEVMQGVGYTASVYEDDDGQRYVGVREDVAPKLMARWEREYGVEYDRETGRFASEASDGAVSDSGSDTSNESDGEETDSDESDDAETYTCAGKGGDCSREVDEPGQRCWQHSSD